MPITHNPPSPPGISGVLVPVTRGQLARVEPAARPPVVLDAVLLDNQRPGRTWRDRVRVALIVLGWLAALAAAAATVWLTAMAFMSLITTITALIAWVHTHWLISTLAVVALLVWLLARPGGGSGCAGLHCGGCH